MDNFLRVDTVELGPLIKMTITHLPTGISVSGEGNKRFLLKDQLLEELGERIKLPAGTHD